MTKQLIPRYAFDASARTVEFSEFDQISIDRVLLVVNAATGTILYSMVDPAKGGTVSGNVLTLETDTTTMSDSDPLTIMYFAKSGDPQYDKTVVGNARSTFRDGFNGSGPRPDPAVWDVDLGTGNHIVNSGGNSTGSSYLRISLDPFVESSEVAVTSVESFSFPMRVGFGVSISQRIVGQEIFTGIVGADETGTVEMNAAEVDKALPSTITIASNVATIVLANHGYAGGDRVAIYGAAEHRLNVGPVIVTVVDKNTITVPLTLANGTYSATGGFLRHADPLRGAKNGLGLLYENATATNASFVSRRDGEKYRSLNSSTATSVATQANASPYTDAFNAAAINELYASMDEVYYRSYTADSVAGPTGSGKYSQGIPDESKDYKLQVRARNLTGYSRPVARITAISKTASTTATVTTSAAHGLVTGDQVQIYGVRDQTNFPNLTAQTTVASAPTSTTFTIVIGTSSTTSSAGGTVFKNEGSVLAPGVFTQVAQSIARTNGVLTVTGNATWATPLPGEYVNLHGLETTAIQYEGAYKVLRVNGTALELEAPGADFGSITTGGSVIKRTDVRVHFVRVMDYTRHVVEVTGGRGNTNDGNNAVPVAITSSAGVPAVQSTGASTTQWSAAGWGGFLVNDIVSAAITSSATSAAVAPGSIPNIGTYTHSFSAVVTAVSGTTPTLDISVEESPDNGVNWVRIYDFPRITAAGTFTSPPIQATWGTRYRYVRTVGGTTPSFTMALNRMQFSLNIAPFRSFVDRSALAAAAPTVGTLTPVYFIERATAINATLTLGPATTAPVVTLEGSEDGTNWYALPGGVLTGTASSTVMVNSVGSMAKFIRGRVTTAGAALTGDRFVTIKAMES